MRRTPFVAVAAAVAALAVAVPAHAQKAAQKPAQKAAAAPVQKPAAKPIQKPVQKPAPRPAERPPVAAAPVPAVPVAARDTAVLDAAGQCAATVVAPKGSAMRTSPDGAVLATLPAGAQMAPLARERGWVRVRIEGWVPERDVVPADSTLRIPLSAADLRADPAGTRGKIVRWEVEVLSLQTADPLRRDLAPDEPYLLARGPGSENAIVYLAVPPSLVATARTLAARSTAHAIVSARVRNARSEPLGVPILDLLSLSRQ